MPQIEIYTTNYCPYCDAAKKLLQSKKLPFTEVDVSDPEKKAALKERTGFRTVPQIFIDGKLIGGYQELKIFSDEGKL